MKSQLSLQSARRLIVGLGNPGLAYSKTRHNAGFMVVQALAEKMGLSFKSEAKFQGKIAHGEILGQSVTLLLPQTYMNLSGGSVQRVKSFYKIESENLLVISDDVAIAFGEIRLRKGGSSGGQKGLQNISESLGSFDYPRLRVGIGDEKQGSLEDYVLSRFTESEQEQFVEIKKKCVEAIFLWLKEGIDKAMNQVNKKPPVVGEEK